MRTLVLAIVVITVAYLAFVLAVLHGWNDSKNV